jgi:hypothetical protein
MTWRQCVTLSADNLTDEQSYLFNLISGILKKRIVESNEFLIKL